MQRLEELEGGGIGEQGKRTKEHVNKDITPQAQEDLPETEPKSSLIIPLILNEVAMALWCTLRSIQGYS